LPGEAHAALPLPDPLFVALPDLRRALLDNALDTALRIVAEGLAGALGPAVAQVWIADPAPWTSEQVRAGGIELFPSLRPRAMGRSLIRAYPGAGTPSQSGSGEKSCPLLRLPMRDDPLISEVATARRPVVLFGADEHPLASEWQHLVPAPVASRAVGADGLPSPRIGTLVAYPLRARGQFLGVLAVGARDRLSARHLAALDELAHLLALAADRDRLLSYSRGQEALAQTVVRHAPVAIAVLTGPDHVFALTNPTFNLLLGVEAEARLTGQRLHDAVPERARSLAGSLRLDAVYTGGEPQAMLELPILHLDRGMTYWNVTSSPLPGVSSSVGGVLVAAVDVTRQVIARQRAQEAAEVAQERIGQMMTLHATSLAVAGQLGADARSLLADILQRSISLLNARAGAVYVRDPRQGDLEVVVSQGLRGDYTGARIRAGEGLAGRVALTGQGIIVDDYRTYPFQAAIYDGEDFSAVMAVPLIQRGQVVGVLDVLDDANRRAFTSDDLWLLDLFAAQAAQAVENARTYVQLERAYRKQRELDRMKDDFIATASHELRTPLTGVQGFLDLLLDYPGSRDEKTATEFLQKAAESAQELAEIAERLLQTSRLDTGRFELHLDRVRLATVVEATLRSFRELQDAQGQTHELVAEISPELYVRADLGRLKEVLDNLVGNAMKYSPQGGRVVVRSGPAIFGGSASVPLSRVEIDEHPTLVLPQLGVDIPDPENDPVAPLPAVVAAAAQEPYVVVTVSDQGMGIPEEERSRLFGRFSRLDAARTSQIRGTGLGLYICRQVVRAMDGDAWLKESTPGAGSTFAFALPLGVAAPVESQVTAPLPMGVRAARGALDA
jgi:signal transduction histidine kinase